VTGVIEGEAVVFDGAAPTADVALFFENDSVFTKMIGGAQASGSSPDDDGRGLGGLGGRKTMLP
jgi:hypothetical protein